MRMTTRDEVGGGYEELEQVERVVERGFEVVVGIEAGAGIEVEVEAASGLARDTSSIPMAEPDAGTWIEGVH